MLLGEEFLDFLKNGSWFNLLRLPVAVLQFLIYALFFLFMGTLHLFAVSLLGYKKGTALHIPWYWGRVSCWILGVHLKITGVDKIPKDKGLVFLFNHSSYFDISLLFSSYKSVFNFALKSYVTRVPVMGAIIRVVKPVIIYKDLQKSIESFRQAEERVKKGDRFMMSPEGTRSKDHSIAPFKSGPFIFALKTGADIVPIVLTGAERVWPKQDLIPCLRRTVSRVEIEFLEPVSITEFSDENRKVKAEGIRQIMGEKLEKTRKKLKF